MTPDLRPIIEALLFVSADPLSSQLLAQVTEVPEESVKDMLRAMGQEYGAPGHGVRLVEVAGGYQFVTQPELAPWITRWEGLRHPQRLSRAALETLAIVAYRQPITKPEVEGLRGVDTTGVLYTLLDRRLIRICGRKDAVGRPISYGTTPEFLRWFGLRDLEALPTLNEYEETPVVTQPDGGSAHAT